MQSDLQPKPTVTRRTRCYRKAGAWGVSCSWAHAGNHIFDRWRMPPYKLLLFLVVTAPLWGCATISRPSADSASYKYSADAAQRWYLDCTFDYANRYAPTAASASEIADAAISSCETHLQDYQRAMTDYVASGMTTRRGSQAAHEGVAELVRDARSSTRGQVIGRVLSLRSQK